MEKLDFYAEPEFTYSPDPDELPIPKLAHNRKKTLPSKIIGGDINILPYKKSGGNELSMTDQLKMLLNIPLN